MRGYAHSNCKYLRIIKMHDYHESKTVLTINDNHEFKAENVLNFPYVPIFVGCRFSEQMPNGAFVKLSD